MVKNLTEMHGGSVEAASAGLNQGSEFTLRLPLLRPADIPAQSASSVEQVVGMGGGQQKEKSLKILVVDDNMDSASSLGELLDLWGHQTKVMHNGPDAIRAALGIQPDVVLLDIGLPGMNGYEVARRMRTEAALDGAALIAITGYGMEEDRRRTAQAGFQNHFTKPIDLNALQKLLQQLLGIDR